LKIENLKNMPKKEKDNKKELLQAPKGTRDILPDDAHIWQKIEEKARAVAEFYGFQPIRTPHIEHAEIFAATLGEVTDVVEKQMYSFKTRGGDHLALRPEGTVPIMRAYIEHGMKTWPQPVMLYYHGSYFRHEKPQHGRYREFGQFGVEILGDESATSDAVIIRVLTLILKEIGVKNYVVRINTLGDKECRAIYRKELVNYLRKQNNYLCKDCKNRLKVNPLRVLDCKNESCVEVKEKAPQMIEHVCAPCKAHFKELLVFLDEMKIPYELDHYLVRGLDYYSRTVFEIMIEGGKEMVKEAVIEKQPNSPAGEEEAGAVAEKEIVEEKPEKDDSLWSLAMGGGGRYDYLGQALANRPVPAAGGALGLDRLAEAAKSLGLSLTKRKQPKIFLIQLGPEAKRKSFSIVEGFREAGMQVAKSFSRDSISSQLKIAAKLGVSYTIIIGQKEAFDNTAIVRFMDSGIQETVIMDHLIDYLKEKIKKHA
jgi:histidyl-tRNA synthetase